MSVSHIHQRFLLCWSRVEAMKFESLIVDRKPSLFNDWIKRTSHLLEKCTGRIDIKVIEHSWEALLLSTKDQRIKSNLKLFLASRTISEHAWQMERKRKSAICFPAKFNKEESPIGELMCSKPDLGTHPENMSSLILYVISKELSELCSRPKDLIWEQILI